MKFKQFIGLIFHKLFDWKTIVNPITSKYYPQLYQVKLLRIRKIHNHIILITPFESIDFDKTIRQRNMIWNGYSNPIVTDNIVFNGSFSLKLNDRDDVDLPVSSLPLLIDEEFDGNDYDYDNSFPSYFFIHGENKEEKLITLIHELKFDLDAMASAVFKFPINPSGEVEWFATPYDLFYFSKKLKDYYMGFKTELNPDGRNYLAEITGLEFEIIPMFDVDTNIIHGKQMWYKDYLHTDSCIYTLT